MNGHTKSKTIVGLIGAIAGLFLGSLSAAAYIGSQTRALKDHLDNPAIHESSAKKEERIRRIYDREIIPQLEGIKAQLKRIESKLDK